MRENENMTYHDPWNVLKTVLSGTFLLRFMFSKREELDVTQC
jgi:hypothetical protein